jgi:hypothetical protein
MPRRLPLLLCLLTCACASLPVRDGTQEYHLSAGAPAPAMVAVTDARTAQDRGSADENGTLRVSDRLLSPHPADFLASELSRSIAASPDRGELERYMAGRTIVIKRFAVQEVPYNRQRALPASVPIGQQAIGSLLTAAVDLFSGTKEVRLDVVAEMEGREIGCYAWGSAKGTPSYDATLQPAVDCVDQFMDKLRTRMKAATTPLPQDAAPAASGAAS